MRHVHTVRRTVKHIVMIEVAAFCLLGIVGRIVRLLYRHMLIVVESFQGLTFILNCICSFGLRVIKVAEITSLLNGKNRVAILKNTIILSYITRN